MKKRITDEYRLLIETINETNDRVITNLKRHILYLESELSKKDTSEIPYLLKEYNQLEGSEEKIKYLEQDRDLYKGEVEELKKDLESMGVKHEKLYAQFESVMAQNQRLAAELREIKSKQPKAKKGRGIYNRKTVVMYCQDCGRYFNAKSSAAKRCKECREAKARAYKNEYQKKRRAAAEQK